MRRVILLQECSSWPSDLEAEGYLVLRGQNPYAAVVLAS